MINQVSTVSDRVEPRASSARQAPAGERRDRRTIWLAALLYFALTLVCTWPIARDIGARTFRSGPDTDLLAWTLAWDAHAFVRQPLSPFDANIYYPERHTLAFSENLIGDALFAAPVIWFSHNLTAALNLNMLLSCALCGLGAYLLARRLGVRAAGAIVAGLVFAFSPPRFFRIAQPHLASVEWIPFALAFTHAYLDGGRRRDLWIALGFFSLQALASGHGAALLVVALAILVGWRLLLGQPIALRRRLADIGLPGLVLLAPAALVFIPYLEAQKEAGLERFLTPDWGTSWESFLESPSHVHQFLISLVPSLRINDEAQNALFPGIAALALTAIALWPTRSTARRSSPALHRLSLTATLVALVGTVGLICYAVSGPFKIKWDSWLIVSVGTPWRFVVVMLVGVGLRAALHRFVPFQPLRWFHAVALVPGRVWGRLRSAWRRRADRLEAPVPAYSLMAVVTLAVALPQPYGLWRFVYWWPGFNFIRVPARISILTVLSLALLAGIGFERLAARWSMRRRAAAALAAGAIIVGECLAIPMPLSDYSTEIPAIDRWLDGQPKPFTVAEFPVLASRTTSRFEGFQTQFMLHSTAHWQKTIHGYSGHRTQFHEVLYDALADFPTEEGLRRLEELGVTYAVVHTDYYEDYKPGYWRQTMEPKYAAFGDRLRLLHVEGAGRVYEVVAARPGPRP